MSMLFLLGGRYKEVARIVLGVVILAVGLLMHHGIILVIVGAVLIAWGAAGAIAQLRNRRRTQASSQNQGGWTS